MDLPVRRGVFQSLGILQPVLQRNVSRQQVFRSMQEQFGHSQETTEGGETAGVRVLGGRNVGRLLLSRHQTKHGRIV